MWSELVLSLLVMVMVFMSWSIATTGLLLSSSASGHNEADYELDDKLG